MCDLRGWLSGCMPAAPSPCVVAGLFIGNKGMQYAVSERMPAITCRSSGRFYDEILNSVAFPADRPGSPDHRPQPDPITG